MNAIKKILFPTDFSEASRAAIPAVKQLAESLGTTVDLLFVTEGITVIAPDATSMYAMPPESIQEINQAAEQHLREIFPVDWQVKHSVRIATRIGRPFREIIAYADEHQIDLIIMGTHGHTGPLRILLGSVAENVVRHANCPVMTVRPKAQ